MKNEKRLVELRSIGRPLEPKEQIEIKSLIASAADEKKAEQARQKAEQKVGQKEKRAAYRGKTIFIRKMGGSRVATITNILPEDWHVIETEIVEQTDHSVTVLIKKLG